MVFYRKYRPQLIDDLDNADIRAALQSIFSGKQSSVPHAFLFTGPKGLGKTSTARIIAKVVNCEKRKDSIEPCNECEQCLSITNGTNMDILEIDAASNRGIDEIRELKEKIRLAPLSAKKKVYIIDEVHMLTTEAFNALLKTLEEPPAHAMFILCTTESHKIPSTILSRCFHLSFHLATEEELVRAFGRIAKGERITIDNDSLQMIAQLAEGGFRDGVKILEEVVALAGGNPITKEFVEEKYKISSIKYQGIELLTALHAKDMRTALQIVGKVSEQGVDVKHFLQQLMEELHGRLLAHVEGKPAAKETVSVVEIKKMFHLFSKAYADMKVAVIPQLPLELVIIEYCQEQDVIARNEATKSNLLEGRQSPEDSHAESNTSNGGLSRTEEEEVTVSSLRKQVGTMKKIQALYGEQKKEVKADEGEKVTISRVELMHVPAEGEMTKEWLSALWSNIISEMKSHNHTIAGVLRGCAIKSYDKKSLVILASYKFHKERLDEVKTRQALVQVCKLLTGNDVSVEVELKNSN